MTSSLRMRFGVWDTFRVGLEILVTLRELVFVKSTNPLARWPMVDGEEER